jgi:TonB family protein
MKMTGGLALATLLLVSVTWCNAFADDVAACATPGKMPRPVVSSHTLPFYPRPSVMGHEQGQTILAVHIGLDGAPAEVTVTQSSGHQRLDDAAVQHIKTHWRWEPPTEDCKPAAIEAQVVVGWHLASGFPPRAKAGINIQPSYYPPGAAERFEMGDTYLELSIGDGGGVKDGRVVYSSGYPDLDEKALAVVKEAPGALAGQPAGTEVVLIRWTLPPAVSKGVEIVSVSGFVMRMPD